MAPVRSTSAIVLALGGIFAASSALGASAQSVALDSAAASLNHLNFHGNVVEGDRAENWVVLFCVEWYGPCEELRRGFLGLAHQQSMALNAGRLFTDAVRFAEVDCAVDKVLCNEQLIETYPMVVHYARGQRVAEWSGEGGSYEKELRKFSKWVRKELDPSRASLPHPSHVEGPSLESPLPSDQAAVAARARMMPLFVAILAATAWILGQGAELLRTAQAALQQSARGRIGQAASGKKRLAPGASTTSTEEAIPKAVSAADDLARRLPKEWAQGRGSIEL
mmetsp:Transcript_111807/g.238843  ORF Transcript_111807/g.238843 Transcript_111807/m.238843 type:complete len:280 (-) Transcript_111807:88-927(-)